MKYFSEDEKDTLAFLLIITLFASAIGFAVYCAIPHVP